MRRGGGSQEPMPLHGVGPQPWQVYRFMPTTIGVCHVQQPNHDSIKSRLVRVLKMVKWQLPHLQGWEALGKVHDSWGPALEGPDEHLGGQPAVESLHACSY